MSALRRKAVQTAGRLRATRPYSTGQHGKTGDEVHHFAGSSTEHGHHSAGPKSESLGSQLYISLAAVPIAIGVYVAAQPGKDGKPAGLTSFIDSYSYYQEKWAARNTLHEAMVQQAAFDRNLYQSNKGSAHIDLKFPEILNTGSPFNVVAGQGSRNMEELVAHYEKVNAETTEKVANAVAKREA